MVTGLTSCDDETIWEQYADWREINNKYFLEQAQLRDSTGELYFQGITPVWNPGSQVLMHFYNDRELTKGNLMPLYGSKCQAIYKGQLCDGRVFDTSYARPDSVVDFKPSDMMQGWAIAIMYMHVGDSARVVIPYGLGYGHQVLANSIIDPYSTLIFDVKLTNILDYEIQ